MDREYFEDLTDDLIQDSFENLNEGEFGWRNYKLKNLVKDARSGKLSSVERLLPVYEQKGRDSNIARMVEKFNQGTPEEALHELSKIGKWYTTHVVEQMHNVTAIRPHDLYTQSLEHFSPGQYRVQSFAGKHIADPTMPLTKQVRNAINAGTFDVMNQRPYSDGYMQVFHTEDGGMRFITNTGLSYPMHFDVDGDIIMGLSRVRIKTTGRERMVFRYFQFPSTDRVGRLIENRRYDPTKILKTFTNPSLDRVMELGGEGLFDNIRKLQSRSPDVVEEMLRKQINLDVIGVTTNKYEIQDLFEAFRALQRQPEELRNAILNSPEKKVAFLNFYKQSKLDGSRREIEDIVKAVARGTKSVNPDTIPILQRTIGLDILDDFMLKWKSSSSRSNEELMGVLGTFFGSDTAEHTAKALRAFSQGETLTAESFITSAKFKFFSHTKQIEKATTEDTSMLSHLLNPVFSADGQNFGLLEAATVNVPSPHLPSARVMLTSRDPLGRRMPFVGGRTVNGVSEGAFMGPVLTDEGMIHPMKWLEGELERERRLGTFGKQWAGERLPGMAVGKYSLEALTSQEGYGTVVQIAKELGQNPDFILKQIRMGDEKVLQSILTMYEMKKDPYTYKRVMKFLKKLIPQMSTTLAFTEANGTIELSRVNQELLSNTVAMDIGVVTNNPEVAIQKVMDLGHVHNLAPAVEYKKGSVFRFFKSYVGGNQFNDVSKRYIKYMKQARNAVDVEGLNVAYHDISLDKLADFLKLKGPEEVKRLYGTATNQAIDPGVGVARMFRSGADKLREARLQTITNGRISNKWTPQTPHEVSVKTFDGIETYFVADPGSIEGEELFTKLITPEGQKIEFLPLEMQPRATFMGNEYNVDVAMTMSELQDKGVGTFLSKMRDAATAAGETHLQRFEELVNNPTPETLRNLWDNLPRADVRYGSDGAAAIFLPNQRVQFSTLDVERKLGAMSDHALNAFKGMAGREAQDTVLHELLQMGYDEDELLTQMRHLSVPNNTQPIHEAFSTLGEISRVTGLDAETLNQLPHVVRMNSIVANAETATKNEAANVVHVASEVLGSKEGNVVSNFFKKLIK
jgi:hypothetical protein